MSDNLARAPRTAAAAADTATDFFLSVRRLEQQLYRQLPQAQRWRALIGTDALPGHETLRFKARYRLDFPATSHRPADTVATEESRAVLHTDILQLMGTEGVLPQHYSRMVISRLKQRDTAMADFMDMFHHRLLSLLYRSWTKYRLVPQYEASRQQGVHDPVSRLLDGLTANRTPDANQTRYYAGHFARRVRSARALQDLLADYLRAPVRVDEHVGDWLQIAEHNRSRLQSAGKQSFTLGQGVLIGRRAWSIQSRIRVVIELESFQKYGQLMPGTERFLWLQQLITDYVPSHIRVDLVFRVRSERRPRGFRERPQLSRSSWLASGAEATLEARFSLRSGE